MVKNPYTSFSALDKKADMKKLSAKELFDKYDKDESGTISFDEFRKILPALGIELSMPKQIEYFQLCDKDGNGEIDFEEFKVSLFASDTEEVNTAGFNAGMILRPRDAFDMFDKDGSGKIDEEEFHFLLKYLNIDIDEDKHEKMFRKYDRNNSGYLDFTEFKMAWLRLANTRKELKDRGIEIPTLATKFKLIQMLERALEEEEEQECLALGETKKWQTSQNKLKSKRDSIVKAKTQARAELCSALDAGGSVYVFGNGSLNQFGMVPRLNMNTPFFKQKGQDLIQSLWSSRVGSSCASKRTLNNSSNKAATLVEDMKLNMDEVSLSTKDYVLLDRNLNIQQNTVWLWGRECKGIAASESVLLAYDKCGSLYSWGGNDQWCYHLEKARHTHSRCNMTPRSNELLGCQPTNEIQSGGEHSTHSKYTKNDEIANELKTVLQYYNAWKPPPDRNINLLDHARKCLRNEIQRERMVQSLQLRGKNAESLTKLNMVEILYKDIQLEHKMLGEATHLELRDLENEMVEFRLLKKFKLAKRRQFRFVEIWRPLRLAQRMDHTRKKVLDQHLQSESDSDLDTTIVESQEEPKRKSEDFPIAKESSEFAFNGLTPRAPPPSTQSSSLNWKAIDAGANHAGLIDDQGCLWMWGMESIGRLGRRKKLNGEKESKLAQHQFSPQRLDVTNVQQFSCGYSHTAAINKDGELCVWGSGSCGKLGFGDITSTQECFSSIPITLKSFASNKVVRVSCGSSHTACVDSDGGLWVWGSGGGGRLGLGHNRDELSPQRIKTVEEQFVDVSCGNSQTVAITAIFNKTEICNMTKVNSISGGNLYVAGPAEVLGSPNAIFGTYAYFSLGSQQESQKIKPVPIRNISAGYSHQSAVTIDGELFAWGDNSQGCSGQDTKIPFITHPVKVALYNKSKDLADGKPTRRSVSYGNQPFFEVDLKDVASIREIKLWNNLNVPNNPAIDENTFTGRLFPCWILISHEKFPDSVGEGELDAALQLSVMKKRFEENVHASIWKPPRGTKGRYVRVQMEGLNNMEFDKLQVFGSYNADTLEEVSSVTCGKRVTAVIVESSSSIDDITNAYERAVAADPSNASILHQYDIYKKFRACSSCRPSISSKLATGCILCTGKTFCPLCQLKNDFKSILNSQGNRKKYKSLEDITNVLLGTDDKEYSRTKET